MESLVIKIPNNMTMFLFLLVRGMVLVHLISKAKVNHNITFLARPLPTVRSREKMIIMETPIEAVGHFAPLFVLILTKTIRSSS